MTASRRRRDLEETPILTIQTQSRAPSLLVSSLQELALSPPCARMRHTGTRLSHTSARLPVRRYRSRARHAWSDSSPNTLDPLGTLALDLIDC